MLSYYLQKYQQQSSGGSGNWYDGAWNYSKGFAENLISSVTLTLTGVIKTSL